MLAERINEQRLRGPSAARIELECSRDAINLIDAFRARRIAAALAETPGAWHVAVEHGAGGALRGDIAGILATWLGERGLPATLVHLGPSLYLVEPMTLPADGVAVVVTAAVPHSS
jgi:hypothetical protein